MINGDELFNPQIDDELYHYGMPERSGRYPFGSGEDPYQGRNMSFMADIASKKKEGMTEKQIADGYGVSIQVLRARNSIAKDELRASKAAQALTLKDKGMSNVAIGETMGLNESTVRLLLNPALLERTNMTRATSQAIKEAIGEKGFVDIGHGVESHMGVSKTKLQTAVELAKEDGYTIHYLKTEQIGMPGKFTSIKVIGPPGATYKDAIAARDEQNIKLIGAYSEDGGNKFTAIRPPASFDSKRLQVRYAEDGGALRDGVLEVRRGVDEVSLGDRNYAQVRVLVDGTHYAKGMAMYSDDLPPGVDIRFNTNKSKGTPALGDKKDNTVLKHIKADPEDPFGAVVRQKEYIGKDGKKHISVMNAVNEEGDWETWSKTLSSQFLSKQSPVLAERQLKRAYDARKAEFDEIMSLTNPVVKQKLLQEFADSCDSDAVHLKAAAMPRQASHVILPFPKMKEGEVYAPNYNDGEKLALVRHPHGGIFEIPVVTVNNKYGPAKEVILQAKDAIGIHPKVAQQLSGADFDGDSVICIPTNGRTIRTSSTLKGLENFDPKVQYPSYAGMKRMSPEVKGRQMGDISNLITDMTIKQASESEISRAVRHSMVVIDAEKHNLNWKESERKEGIGELKKKYQGAANAGASTLISRAKSPVWIPDRVEGQYVENPLTGKKTKQYIDKATGRKLYSPVDGTYLKKVVNKDTGEVSYEERRKGTYFKRVVDKKTGEVSWKEQERQTSVSKMEFAFDQGKDAYSLSSGTIMEAKYADHANSLKSLANSARRAYLNTPSYDYDPVSRKRYSGEVDTLKKKLSDAEMNAPLERHAQLIAGGILSKKKADNPELASDKTEYKKVRNKALKVARIRMGANKKEVAVQITDKEWEAIQAKAVTPSMLRRILQNTDTDRVKQLATPRPDKGLSTGDISRAKSMIAQGYTQAQIADQLGVSSSTISRLIK